MALVTNVKYEPLIKKFENISPANVLNMLKDVRADIGRLDPNFANADLLTVLKAVETGKHEIKGAVSIRVNLSSAQGIIETYREYSEGGCHSCVSLGREVIDAQDAEVAWYCMVEDPGYDKIKGSYTIGCDHSGHSKKTKKHYDTPCKAHKPRFSPKLEKLIAEGS